MICATSEIAPKIPFTSLVIIPSAENVKLFYSLSIDIGRRIVLNCYWIINGFTRVLKNDSRRFPPGGRI